ALSARRRLIAANRTPNGLRTTPSLNHTLIHLRWPAKSMSPFTSTMNASQIPTLLLPRTSRPNTIRRRTILRARTAGITTAETIVAVTSIAAVTAVAISIVESVVAIAAADAGDVAADVAAAGDRKVVRAVEISHRPSMPRRKAATATIAVAIRVAAIATMT